MAIASELLIFMNVILIFYIAVIHLCARQIALDPPSTEVCTPYRHMLCSIYIHVLCMFVEVNTRPN